jgi:hypothetical protein
VRAAIVNSSALRESRRRCPIEIAAARNKPPHSIRLPAGSCRPTIESRSHKASDALGRYSERGKSDDT